ncbi:MAG: short-chain dehydrogenase, partial [Alphaproteobacteria bacterium]
ALEALTDAQRLEHRDSPIEFILIEPGPIPTDFRINAAKQFEKWIDWKNAHRKDYYEAEVRKRLYDSSGKKDFSELPVSAVTAKLIHALESKRPKPRYYVTAATYFADIMRRFLPTRLLDLVLARQ